MRRLRQITDIKHFFAAILLVLFYISEGFSKYGIYYGGEKSDIPRFIKFAVFIFLFIALARNLRSIVGPILLAILFIIGQIFLLDGFKMEILVSCAKLLFPIFLFIYFNKVPIAERYRNLLFQTFEYVLIANGILIFIGLIMKVQLFDSYLYGRSGYNGLFITSATSSYVYAIAIFYFLLKLKKSFFTNWKTIFVIACAILTGTKIVYIALIAAILIYLLFFVNFKKKQRRVLIFAVITVFALIGYFLFFQYGIFNEIRQERGLSSAIFSFRDDLLLERTLPFIKDNWTWPNYLFGGINDLSLRSQLGFMDVFLFWGVLGGLFYFYVFYKSFVSFSVDKSVFYILLSLALMVFLAGNFFENASVAIYLLVLKEKLISRDESFSKNTHYE